MVTKADIKRLKGEEDSAREAYYKAEGSRIEAEKELFYQENKIRPGDRIIISLRGRTEEHEVCGLNEFGWLLSRKIKKDGTPGGIVSTVYGDWKKK